MKIQQLIEDLVNADITRKNFNGTLKGKDTGYSNSKKQLSNGSQASVKPDPNDPHMVKKHNTKVYPEKQRPSGHLPSRTNDGFNDYIEYLINHNLTDNIHFPKIYNVKTITDKNDRKIHTYTMEKLIESTALTTEEIEAFMENSVADYWKNRLEDSGNKIDRIVRVVGYCLEGVENSSEVFIDDELIQAVNILKNIKININGNIDLSESNVMWRRTPYGMILVFTDPFF